VQGPAWRRSVNTKSSADLQKLTWRLMR